MKSFEKSEIRALLYFILASLTVFLTAHIYYLSENSSIPLYLHLYSTKIWDFFFPLICAYLMLMVYAKRGYLSAFVLALSLLITRLAYYFPYFYEYFVLEAGYTSGDALFLSSLRSLLMISLSFIHILALFFGMLLLLNVIKVRGNADATSTKEKLLSNDSMTSSFDFSSGAVIASFALSLAQLVYSLVLEIIDTVEFLSTSIGTLLLSELLTMIFNYILLIALSLISHFIILAKIRKKQIMTI